MIYVNENGGKQILLIDLTRLYLIVKDHLPRSKIQMLMEEEKKDVGQTTKSKRMWQKEQIVHSIFMLLKLSFFICYSEFYMKY